MKNICLSVFAAIIGLPLMAQNSALLKLNPEKNKVYRMKSSSEQTITQTVNGNQQTVESNVGYTVSLKMIDATQDFLILETRFDTLSTKTNTMGKIVSFTSASEGNIASSEMSEIMSCIMNRLSKNAIYLKMDYSGKPLEVLNAKMLSDIILKDTSAITLTGPTAGPVKQQVASTVSEANIRNMLGPFTWTLPGKEVSVGDTWLITQQVNSGGMLLDIKTNFRLDKISEGKAFITVESNIKAPENALPIKSGVATVTYDNLQGASKSKLTVDTITGFVVEDNSETHISGKLGISGPGFSMEMPMDIIGKSEIKAIK
ncbi:MAG: hypothetical protein GX431_06735 [Bacteroidales bacterium]|jgi:hypothetical protein|nr:hypothetical protein [Bacteroidales bacterium]